MMAITIIRALDASFKVDDADLLVAIPMYPTSKKEGDFMPRQNLRISSDV
jgi:hypothetical protein